MFLLKNPYRSIAASFMMLLIALPFLTIIGIVVEFEINKQYYAAEACIQKEIKNNCCQGSCVLGEKINTTQTTDSNNSLSIPTANIEIVIPQNEEFTGPFISKIEDLTYFFQGNRISNGFTKIIAPPPELLS